MVRTSYLMFAYCLGQSVVVHGGFTWSCGMCTPLQSKTIRNSRVLGYGRLNRHAASIVSKFSKRRTVLEKGVVPGRYLQKELCTWEVRMMKSRKLFLQEVLQRKKPSLLKMIFNKTLLICDIYKRNYIYLLKYLLQQRCRDVNQPWWIFHPFMGSEPYV